MGVHETSRALLTATLYASWPADQDGGAQALCHWRGKGGCSSSITNLRGQSLAGRQYTWKCRSCHYQPWWWQLWWGRFILKLWRLRVMFFNIISQLSCLGVNLCTIYAHNSLALIHIMQLLFSALSYSLPHAAFLCRHTLTHPFPVITITSCHDFHYSLRIREPYKSYQIPPLQRTPQNRQISTLV